MPYMPKSSSQVNQIFYGLMLSGVINFFIFVYVYKIFWSHALGKPEFYLFATLVLAMSLVIRNYLASSYKRKLLIIFPEAAKNSIDIFLLSATNSESKEIKNLGQKYWICHLLGGYLAGTFFGWFLSLFIYFI